MLRRDSLSMKTVAANRKARFDYEILETIEAGIILTGPEVKSCREGHVNMNGAYVSFLGGGPVLKHVSISKYSHAANVADYDPLRDRPLLLKQSDIDRLASVVAEKGVTLVPLEVKAGRYIKVVLGLGRGRKRFDKRQKIKERDVSRQLRQKGEY